ncbi:MAG: DUF2163 domain-containing protein [Bradyrhizobium sp.]|nr:MAG: DUF2163 domain-containing protein [Bradyrhizobium sp.]
MRNLSPALAAFLNDARSADATIFKADAYALTLKSGATAYWSSLDVPFAYNGATFLANGPMVQGLKMKCAVGLEVDRQQVVLMARRSRGARDRPCRTGATGRLARGRRLSRFGKRRSRPRTVTPAQAAVHFNLHLVRSTPMSASPPEGAAWGIAEWAITGLTTLLASVGAFLWRLSVRLESIESSVTRQRLDLDQTRQSSDTAVARLAERYESVNADHYRLLGIVGSLPTRADVRSLEERIAERLDALGARLDRLMDA